jgi:hypothetical protein
MSAHLIVTLRRQPYPPPPFINISTPTSELICYLWLLGPPNTDMEPSNKTETDWLQIENEASKRLFDWKLSVYIQQELSAYNGQYGGLQKLLT